MLSATLNRGCSRSFYGRDSCRRIRNNADINIAAGRSSGGARCTDRFADYARGVVPHIRSWSGGWGVGVLLPLRHLRRVRIPLTIMQMAKIKRRGA